MWFRGVSASMGLCFDLGTVLEGHPDVLFAVDGDEVSKDAENKSMWVFVLMLFGFYFVLYAVNYFFYYLTTVFVFERESFFGVSFTGLLIAFLVYTITISNVCNRISPTKNRGTFALIVIAFMIVDVILAVSAKQQLIHPIFISLGAQHRLFMMLLILFSGSKKWTSGHNNTTEPSSS